MILITAAAIAVYTVAWLHTTMILLMPIVLIGIERRPIGRCARCIRRRGRRCDLRVCITYPAEVAAPLKPCSASESD